MKLAIVGSRNIMFENAYEILDKTIKKEKVTTIISGGARGIDTVAKEYAINNNIELIEYLPDYKRYGRGAPLVRNSDIIKNSDFVLALWDGKSRGTKDSINKARKMNKTTKIIYL